MAVGGWAQEDPVAMAREFAQKHNLTFPVLVDGEDEIFEIYGVQGVPTNVVVDRNGRVTYVQAGFDEEGVRKAVDEALQ